MVKKIIIGLFTFLILIALGFFVWYYMKINTPVSETISAIPKNAIFILETKSFSKSLNKLKHNTTWWSAFSEGSEEKIFEKNIFHIDSLLQNDLDLKNILEKESIFISAHPAGANNFKLLYTFKIPSQSMLTISDINNKLIAFDGNVSFSNANYDDAVVYNTAIKLADEKQKIYYSLYSGVFILSSSNLLVEDAIRQLKSEKSLMNDIHFEKLTKTAGYNVDANVYFNFSSLRFALYPFVKEKWWKNIERVEDLALWSLLDTRIKEDVLLMNGFSSISDSSNLFLNIFKNQKAQDIELTRILSSKTPAFIYFSFDDFETFNENYIKYLAEKNAKNNIENDRREFYVKYEKELKDFFIDWMGEEMALVFNIEDKSDILVLKTRKLELALQQLDELEKLTKTSEIEEVVDYKDFKIKKLNSGKLLQLAYGEIAEGISKPFYTNIGKYLLFSSSIKSLKNTIDDFILRKTLNQDFHYKDFNKNLSSVANFYLFANNRHLIDYDKNYLSEKALNIIENHRAELRKIDGFAVQFSNDKDLVYTNIAIKHNNNEVKEFNTLWEKKFDFKIVSGPHFVKNHYTGENEIFIQLENFETMLLDDRGNILWKKKIDDKIRSEVVQIDVYKNNKLQMLFNTNEELYLMDRNGDQVEDFPVKIRPMISNNFKLLDYDNNKDYRILIASANKKVYNYNALGELVTGFDFGPANDLVNQDVFYFNLKGLDYIVITDKSGKVYVTERRGMDRIILKEKLDISEKHEVQIVKGTSLSSTFLLALNNGVVQKLNFVDELSTKKLPINEEVKTFKTFTDIQKNNRIFISTNSYVKIFNDNFEEIFHHDLETGILDNPVFYPSKDFVQLFGFASVKEDKIYLFDTNFNQTEDSPLDNAGRFRIGYFTEKNNLHLLINADNILKNYQLAD